MRIERIVNRGRVAPSSPKPRIDSGRNSWSSASIVSTIDAQSPEPNLPNEASQRLQQVAVVSSSKKNWIIGVVVVAAVLIVIGVALAVVLSLASRTTTTTTTARTTTSTTTGAPPNKTLMH